MTEQKNPPSSFGRESDAPDVRKTRTAASDSKAEEQVKVRAASVFTSAAHLFALKRSDPPDSPSASAPLPGLSHQPEEAIPLSPV